MKKFKTYKYGVFMVLHPFFLQVDMALDGGRTSGVWSIMTNLGIEATLVLLILIFFSVFSWAIIVEKYITYKKIQKHSEHFLKVFRKSSKFSEVQAVCSKLLYSPFVGLFMAAYAELNQQLKSSVEAEPESGLAGKRKLKISSLESVNRALMRATTVEVNKLERRLGFLATTGSVTPFIGLFGTVWGIMTAFHNIGQQGSASLATVAPGISEALILTAAGLAAAIPAVIFYNILLNRAKIFYAEMDDFSLEFLNITERNFC
jgi:biopolymer transport protein TolQ